MRLICAFSVFDHKLIAWSPPVVVRRGGKIKDKRLVTFQAMIQEKAREAMESQGSTKAHGPVHFDIRFFFPTDDESFYGFPAWVPAGHSAAGRPDLTNLVKSFEDAMQGVVYQGDSQVAGYRCTRRYGPRTGVKVAVYEIEDAELAEDVFDEPPTPFEPIPFPERDPGAWATLRRLAARLGVGRAS